MAPHQPSLYHARISFSLNLKLLHPREVCDAAVKAWRADPARITLSQAEGFVRQIIGWREYMRGVYWAQMPKMLPTWPCSCSASGPGGSPGRSLAWTAVCPRSGPSPDYS
jgi:hypothetical protein